MAEALREHDRLYRLEQQSARSYKFNKNKPSRSMASNKKKEALPGIKWEVEGVYSLYTYHFTNPDNVGDKFENKVSKDGRLINNNLYGLVIRDTVDNEAYSSHYFFGGVDSVGSPIYGYLRSMGFILPTYTYLGFAFGGYWMENKTWEKKQIDHTNGIKISKTNSIVPVVGIEISQKIPLGGGLFLKINNLISPVLSNHSVGLGMEL